MIKRLVLVLIIFLSQFSLIFPSFSKINIFATVDDEIITNYDILKEGRYLIVLNPNLKNLSKKQISDLAKESLITEIIKKKEISKLIDINKKNPFVEDYLSNLLIRLGYENKNNFKDDLLKNKTYSIKEIKSKIKIELFWNELIFTKYNNQVKINEKIILEKINKLKGNKKKEFFLSEIVFNKKNNQDIEELISQIKQSINEIGFENTANIFSISDSSKFGGKIGWVEEKSLSKKIYEKIKDLKANEYSNIIKLENNYILLKVDKIKITETKIDKKKEFQNLLQTERNKKLKKYSLIYFNKTKSNYIINEK